MTANTSLSMTLSQEELFVAMIHLKAEQFPGLDLEVFKELDETQTSLMVGVAERALLARGFLKPDKKGDLQLEPAINGLLAACVFPDKSLFVNRTRPEAGTEEYFFHAYRRMFVMHSIPVTAVHQFIAVEEKDATARAVLSILNLASLPKFEGNRGQINLTIFEEARDVASEKGVEEALKVLSRTELDKKTARELALTLVGMVANTTFAYIDHHDNGQPPQGFTILQGKKALWWLEPIEDVREELISILPISSEDVIQRMKAFLIH